MIFKGPILYLLLDVYFSFQTLMQQPHIMNHYLKKIKLYSCPKG